jgi:nucleotide-binding universal stress UspA family protein
MSQGPVIIGFDGSPSAEHALRQAAVLLAVRTAVVVTVWEAGAAYLALESPAIPAAAMDLGMAAVADQAMFEGVRRTAERGAQLAREQGLETGEGLTLIGEESVAATLVRLARKRDASAIVVGSHGHSRLEQLFLGSTSRHVLEHAHCAVLVVRPSGAS